MPTRKPNQAEIDYARIEKAISFLDEHRTEQPDLDRLARHVHLSPFHFQRLFTRWAGVSPSQFLRHLNRDAALERLRVGSKVLDTALDLGLSGPGRLHDLVVGTDGMSPGEIQSGGERVVMNYGMIPTRFGSAFLAWTPRGICTLRFAEPDEMKETLDELRSCWPKADFHHDPRAALDKGAELFDKPSLLHLRGTPFQLHVWRALLEIPEGTLVGYQTLAKAVGHPKASRAVGTAVGANPVALLIPCHRVIRQTGVLGNYRWGTARKKIISAWEAVHPSL